MVVTAGPVVAAAQAPPDPIQEPAPSRDFFLKVFTGVALSESSDLRIVQPDLGNDLVFEQVTWDDHSLSGPSIPYVAVRGGFFSKRRPWLGASLDVVHYKVFADRNDELRVRGLRFERPIDRVQPLRRIVQQYDIANGINMVLLNLHLRRRLGANRDGRPRGELYLGVGVGPSFLYNQSVIDGELRPGSYDSGRLAAQVLAGAQLNLRRRFDVFFELKRTRVDADGPIARGESESRIDSDHYVVGVGYHF